MDLKIGIKISEKYGKTQKKYEIQGIENIIVEGVEVTIVDCKLLTKKGEIDKRTWSNTQKLSIWYGNKDRYQII